MSRDKPAFPLRRSERQLAWLNVVPLPRRAWNPSNTILLAGTARSGTTWMGQVLGALDGYALVTEPLNPKMPGVLRAGFSWDTWRPEGANWPEGEALLRRMVRGRGVSLKLLHRNGFRTFLTTGLVLKLIRANRLLPWIGGRLGVRGIVHLVRHPCAVVSSQMAHLPDRDPCWDDNLAFLQARLPHLLPLAAELRTESERRALTWALDQYVPLVHQGTPAWITVTYESLVAEGDRRLDAVCSALNVPVSDGAREQLGRNSWQIREHSVDHARASIERRLGVWRERLPPEEVRRILRVVEAVGILGYDDGLLPNGPLSVAAP